MVAPVPSVPSPKREAVQTSPPLSHSQTSPSSSLPPQSAAARTPNYPVARPTRRLRVAAATKGGARHLSPSPSPGAAAVVLQRTHSTTWAAAHLPAEAAHHHPRNLHQSVYYR